MKLKDVCLSVRLTYLLIFDRYVNSGLVRRVHDYLTCCQVHGPLAALIHLLHRLVIGQDALIV